MSFILGFFISLQKKKIALDDGGNTVRIILNDEIMCTDCKEIMCIGHECICVIGDNCKNKSSIHNYGEYNTKN